MHTKCCLDSMWRSKHMLNKKLAVDMRRAATAYDCFIHLRYMSAQEATSNFDSIVQGCSSVSGHINGDLEHCSMMYNSDTLYQRGTSTHSGHFSVAHKLHGNNVCLRPTTSCHCSVPIHQYFAAIWPLLYLLCEASYVLHSGAFVLTPVAHVSFLMHPSHIH